jgi:light-regulated signal transduction histidine kinase (bacteriophytochrome)
MTFDDLTGFSPFPIVELDENSASPKDGFLLPLTQSCRAHLQKGEMCHEHYRKASSETQGTFLQCPYGFTTLIAQAGAFRFALTGAIGYPRFQTAQESRLAKQYSEHRVARQALINAAQALKSVALRMQALETDTVEQHSMALHEIRKLNRQVKQTAERLCQRDSPGDLDAAEPDLVKIFKASELMSRQFDVIEILANEELAKLPLNSSSEVYKIFDKCARIYRTAARKIMLEAAGGFHPQIEVCDKTFHIIPSVLIENALKYSTGDSDVRITLRLLPPDVVMISVSNAAMLKAPLTDAVFRRGYRAANDRDGSGNGLYVAQLVAKQHGSILRIENSDMGGGRTKVLFAISFKIKQ